MGGVCSCSSRISPVSTPEPPPRNALGTSPPDAKQLPEAEEAHRRLLRLDVAGWNSLLAKLEGVFGHKKCNIAATEHRAITLEHLSILLNYAEENCGEWRDTRTWESVSPDAVNLYQLADWCIRPATAREKCSMAELLVAAVSPPDWYVSHWWGEPLRDFFLCIKVHTEIRLLAPTTAYWVCAHANRQWELNEELTKDPSDSSFYKAMTESQGILLVLDKDGTPFKRIWCAYEAYVGLVASEKEGSRLLFDVATSKDSKAYLITDGPTAAEHSCTSVTNAAFAGLQSTLPPEELSEDVLASAEKQSLGGNFKTLREKSFPVEVMELGFRVEVEKASATSEDDQRHILNKIAGRHGLELDLPVLGTPDAMKSYKAVGHRIGSLMARSMWVNSAAARTTRTLGLPALLAADEEREELSFDLFSIHNAETSSAGMIEDIGLSLHKDVKVLKVVLNPADRSSPEYHEATSTTARRQRSRALQSLFLRAPHVENVNLDFFPFWYLIADEDLAAIGKALMGLTKLRRLSLTFNSERIAGRGLGALVHGLAKVTTLEHVSLVFGGYDGQPIIPSVSAQGEEINRKLTELRELATKLSEEPTMQDSTFWEECMLHLCRDPDKEDFSAEEDANESGNQNCDEEDTKDVKEAESKGGSTAMFVFVAPRGPWDSCFAMGLEHCGHLSALVLLVAFSDLSDGRVEALGQAVARHHKLRELTVAFISCGNLSDKGARAFAAQLAQLHQLCQFTKLEFLFQDCPNVEDPMINCPGDLDRFLISKDEDSKQ